MNSIFALRIKKLRQMNNLNQASFAKLIGTNQSTLSAYENGDRLPPFEILLSLATEFQVSLDWLCGLSENTFTPFKANTYADIFQFIMLLKESPLPIDISVSNTEHKSMQVTLTDPTIVHLYEEWLDILRICKNNSHGEKLYQLWKNDILKQYNYPIKNLS